MERRGEERRGGMQDTVGGREDEGKKKGDYWWGKSGVSYYTAARGTPEWTAGDFMTAGLTWGREKMSGKSVLITEENRY